MPHNSALEWPAGHVQVAEHVPGRTPRQCAEHYIFLASRSVRDMSAVWSRAAEMRLLEARAKHCPGMRAPDWEAVARDMSDVAGVQLTVEDCKRKSKLLIRRLHHSGLPERATVDSQWQYVQQHPGALATAQDVRRRELQCWAAERGLSMRPHEPHSEPAPAAAAAAAPELLRQSRYLRALAGLSATPSGLELRGEALNEEPGNPISHAVATRDMVDSVNGRVCGANVGTGVGGGFMDVDARVHPIAAAVISVIRKRHTRGGSRTELGGCVEAPQVANPADVSTVSGLGVAVLPTRGSGVSVPVQGDVGGSSAWVLQVHGAMAEGRRLEDVRTCAERRRARIQTLAQRGRLQVRLCMPQWQRKLVEAAAQLPRTRKPKQPGKRCARQPESCHDRESDDRERALLPHGPDSQTTGGVLDAARAALEELAASERSARTACAVQTMSVKRHQARPPALRTSKASLQRTTTIREAANCSSSTRAARFEEEEPVAVDMQPRLAGRPTVQGKVQPSASRLFATDREALAARATARENPGGRRSGRKRKLTSKVDPSSSPG